MNAREPLHPENQAGLGGLQDQMEMIAHQAIRMHLPLGLDASLAQRGQELLVVVVVPEDILARIPTAMT